MMKKKWISGLLCAMVLSGTLAGCGQKNADADRTSDDETVKLKISVGTDVATAGFEAVAELAEKELGIKVAVETRPAGPEGANLVKTRLASGDMADICVYNSGALFSTLNPEEYFIDISNEEFTGRMDESYKDAVSVDGKTYGVPFQSTQAEGILYNKKIYAKYKLEVPKTWSQFIDNCKVLQENGETAILGTFADSWTAQIPFLGDAYNLLKSNPEFPDEFEAGTAKWASVPAALRSFEKLADTTPYYNKDYLATTYDDGCDIMANGEAAHWFILSKALSNIYELYGTQVNDLGMFPVPGDEESENGMTLWYPEALYGNKNSEHVEAVIKFMEFYVSDEALDAYSAAILPDGPYCITGYELPENAYDAVSEDIQPYFDEGNTAPALEYLTSVKGTDCEAICQELGSGQTTAKEAAEKYDKDCEKMAVQSGLDWQ